MVISLSIWPLRRCPNKKESRTAMSPFPDDSNGISSKIRFQHLEIHEQADDHRLIYELVWIIRDLKSGAKWEEFTRPISLRCNLLAAPQGVDRVGSHRKSPAACADANGSAKAAARVTGDGGWKLLCFTRRRSCRLTPPQSPGCTGRLPAEELTSRGSMLWTRRRFSSSQERI